jgi:hypothetical protein
MMHRVVRKESPPRSRLEAWLLREIRGGGLKALPRYEPVRGRGSACPEHYARALLSGLGTAAGDPGRVERLKDDGRAFRSWVESVHPAAWAGQVL